MSVEAFTWAVYSSRSKGTAKLVLMVIAECASPDGTGAWPAVRTIAKRGGVSVRTARRSIRTLEALGELAVESRPGATHLFRVVMDPGQIDRPPVKLTAPPGQIGRTTPARLTAKPLKEPSLNQKKRASGAGNGFQEWLDHYRETTGRTTVRGSKPARDSFAARLRDGYTLDDLKAATVGCHGDAFLREGGHDVPETILRASRVERYIQLARRPTQQDREKLARQRQQQREEAELRKAGA